MPAPSRDRLARPVDISALFRGASRRVHLMVDEPGLRWAGLSGNPTRNVSGGSVNGGNGSTLRRVGAHRVRLGHHRNFHRSPAVVRENRVTVTPARRGSRRSALPQWYPRTPLREITSIVSAIERRREELQFDQATEPFPETDVPSGTSAWPEHHEIVASTPLPTIVMKPQPSPATQPVKIMSHFTFNPKENQANWDFLTPEKKLLNSIEKVREVWVQELRKLERTPAAKKAERERKVRVLMSMR